MKKDHKSYWLFLAPVLIAYTIVVLLPLICGIFYSFTDWNGIDANVKFIGFKNFAVIFKDKTFLSSFLFTLKFTVISLIVLNVMGFGLALLVTRESKLNNIFRTIFFMPNLIGGLILGFIWQFIFVEVFNNLGTITKQKWLLGWLSDSKTGLWGLVILMAWQMSGYLMVIYIAAIQDIPPELIEASKIDGASGWRIIKDIIIPLVRPAFTVSIFLTLSNSFKLYDQNLSLTAGGPARSTEMLAMNIYNTAFGFNKLGQAQAKAVIFLLIVGCISLLQVHFTQKGEVEM